MRYDAVYGFTKYPSKLLVLRLSETLMTAVIIFMVGLVSEQIVLLRMEQRRVHSGTKVEDHDE
jgi:hypothetical protein